MSELKPCAFCGSSNLHETGNGIGNEFIECSDCGASGPASDHSADAADYWNRRAQPEANADAKDAERYRWLTYAGWIDDAIMEMHGIREGISETLDAAIDRAIQAQEDGHG